jgi:hypothetical protein
MTVSGLRKGIKMAEAGQTDDNRILPNGASSPEIDTTPEWKAERSKMISFILKGIMDQMDEEEKERRARGTIFESLLYSPDHELITKYERLGGKWTEGMYSKYKTQPKMSATMKDEIRLKR